MWNPVVITSLISIQNLREKTKKKVDSLKMCLSDNPAVYKTGFHTYVSEKKPGE